MYLEYFGLDEAPFKITPLTNFFFTGANRSEILDALIYAISNSEGIIKVTGEVGSGKTMLCRMLLDRLPPQIESVYLANPSLSREELLYAIADGLALNLEGQRVNIIMQALQNRLAQKSAEGKCVVVLVDEAHAMPLDTLEELRLLYNLQLGDHKLLQIVLFGQPELNDKLSQPNMRQLKDRIVHHFSMLPLSKAVIESYLVFRLRTAGYRGPNPFSRAAVKLIGTASNGLMRRVNILADKALLAAFVENTHNIEARHVHAAIHDSELSRSVKWKKNGIALAGAATLSVLLVAGMVWLTTTFKSDAEPVSQLADHADPVEAGQISLPAVSAPNVALADLAVATAALASMAGVGSTPLLTQRLTAAKTMLAQRNKLSASIQLFYTTDIQTARLENFLARSDSLGKLAEIYVLPTHIAGKEGIRMLYGHYPNIAAARNGMQQLPLRYKEGFTTALYLLEDARIVSN